MLDYIIPITISSTAILYCLTVAGRSFYLKRRIYQRCQHLLDQVENIPDSEMTLKTSFKVNLKVILQEIKKDLDLLNIPNENYRLLTLRSQLNFPNITIQDTCILCLNICDDLK